MPVRAACAVRWVLGCWIGLGWVGCTVHKIELAPKPLVTATAGATDAAGLPSAAKPAAPQAPWWLGFDSLSLNLLTQQALQGNFDVAAAGERLNQALAAYGRVEGSLLPKVDLTGNFDADAWRAGDINRRQNQWTAGGALTWEVDFFKRLSSIRRSRAADVQSRREALQVVRLAMSVSVAEAYYGILEQRQVLAVIRLQRQTAAQLLRIVEQRYDQGLVSKLDVLQQQAQVADLDSQIPSAESTLQDLQNTLGVLLGGMPGTYDVRGVGLEDDFPTLPESLPVGRPDDLLLQRPDLMAAQSDLISSDADTARALADRLPRFTFSARGLRVEDRSPEGSLLTVGAGLVQPLLDWGDRRAEWVRTQAVYRERMATFTQLYLRSVWEVQGLVQNEIKQRELLERLRDRKVILTETLEQATNRYSAGLTDYLPVLLANQQLYPLEIRLVREQRRLTSLRIALHRSLGGPIGGEADLGLPSDVPARGAVKTIVPYRRS